MHYLKTDGPLYISRNLRRQRLSADKLLPLAYSIFKAYRQKECRTSIDSAAQQDR